MSVSSAVHGGRLLARKRRDDAEAFGAAPDVDGASLADEAAVLAIAQHPGVVALADPPPDHCGEEALWLTHAGERTWSTHPPADDRELAGGLARIAATVADLHDLGVTHGQLDDPAHVIRSTSGRLVLCGFSRAAYADGPADAGTQARRRDDVAALGRLGRLLHAGVVAATGSERATRARLATLIAEADRAPGGIGTTGLLSARELARRAADLASTPPSERRAARSALAWRPSWRRARSAAPSGQSRWAIVVGVAAAIAVVGALAIGPAGSRPPVSAAALSSTLVAAAVPTTSGLPPATSPTTTTSAPPTTTVPMWTADLADATGATYRIDAAGPLVTAVGDWDCDGVATPVALDPASSTVWAFDGWATDGEPTPARFVAVVTGATALAPATTTCPALLVTTPAGTEPLEVAR